jgi:hypothetical protein
MHKYSKTEYYLYITSMMPEDQNGLDFARPPDSVLMIGAEENAAAPHFPPLPNLKDPTVTERSRGEH